MKRAGTLALHIAYSAPDDATARTDAARLLMVVALAVLEGENGDALTGGAWALAITDDPDE